MWQRHVSQWQHGLEPKCQGLCMQAQKFYPADSKANRKFLCMWMTWSTLVFERNLGIWGWKDKRDRKQENMVGVWTEETGMGMEKACIDWRQVWGRTNRSLWPISWKRRKRKMEKPRIRLICLVWEVVSTVFNSVLQIETLSFSKRNFHACRACSYQFYNSDLLEGTN